MKRPTKTSGIAPGLPDDDRADQDEHGEQEAGFARAQLVDQHPAEQDDEDGGDAVHRVHRPDGGPGRLELVDQGRGDGPDDVVGEIAAERQGGDEDEDDETIEAPARGEEALRLRFGRARHGGMPVTSWSR